MWDLPLAQPPQNPRGGSRKTKRRGFYNIVLLKIVPNLLIPTSLPYHPKGDEVEWGNYDILHDYKHRNFLFQRSIEY